jgi:hypothetical protein
METLPWMGQPVLQGDVFQHMMARLACTAHVWCVIVWLYGRCGCMVKALQWAGGSWFGQALEYVLLGQSLQPK